MQKRSLRLFQIWRQSKKPGGVGGHGEEMKEKENGVGAEAETLKSPLSIHWIWREETSSIWFSSWNVQNPAEAEGWAGIDVFNGGLIWNA